ncbi:hypothetical protein X560_0260 [Listeria fleischmannii 1991]|uniref:DUF1433 domain-containing protein n=3 Tax=Listeria fleischmannii TaxID=1069827 RepID=A0A2X3J0D5_9LIST|nr:hypothetical protein [Listeria fleischmannii]KMT61193.1 hypothetical protein X560_0260 [Listeria fleischmannii 1991]SQC67410.1 Uncharacterised protein [Listeria fleischmannii subsp. fleischmannii]
MKKVWMIISIIVVIIIISIGGKLFMDNRKEQKKIEIEKQSVEVLKKTFADIAKVKIERIDYNNMTGSYRIVVTMSNKEGKSAEFSYGFVENDNELGVYGLVDEDVQRKGETLSKVRVIFSDGMEEDI